MQWYLWICRWWRWTRVEPLLVGIVNSLKVKLFIFRIEKNPSYKMLLPGIMLQSYIFLNFLEVPIYPKISMPPNLFCQPATMVPCLRYLTALQTCSHCMNTQSLNYHIHDKFIKEIKEAFFWMHLNFTFIIFSTYLYDDKTCIKGWIKPQLIHCTLFWSRIT